MNWRLYWNQIVSIIWKELLATFKDPKTRIILLLPVIIQGFLFGYAATYNLNKVPYVLIDESHTQTAAALESTINSSGVFELYQSANSPDIIAPLIDSNKVIMAVIIPQDFEEKLKHKQPASITVIANGTNTMTSGLAAAYMGQIISQFNQTWLGVDHKGITIESRTWYNENQQSSWTFLTGLVILISMTQVIMLGGLSVAREREQGTFDQLLVTPVSSMQILIAKSIPPMIIGLFQSTVLLLIAMFWFKVPFRGNIFLVYAVLFTFISSSIGLGLSISAIAKNMQQVLVYVFVFLFPLALLSGLITPVHNMPKILQYLTYGNPMRFSVDAMRRIYLEGAGLTDIWFNFIPMIILIIISMSIAGWLFRNRVG